MLHLKSRTLPDFDYKPFRALPLINTGHRQTLTALLWPTGFEFKPQSQHIITLADGDQLSLEENASTTLAPNAPICMLVHGLTGSHRSNYMMRLARTLTKQGYRACRLNLRGCGTGEGLAKKPYHSGRSDDLKSVIYYLLEQYPKAPIHVLSFSLGANIALKMTGEFGTAYPTALQSVTAVSPPLDLYASVKRIQAPPNRVFDQYFANALVKAVQNIHRYYPELGPVNLPAMRSIFEFDDIYTAPTSGFINALDYYQQSSSKHYLTRINIPTLILHAKDDPLVSFLAFQPNKYANPYINWVLTKQGGHVGFLGQTQKSLSYQWMDQLLLKWLGQF
jgi:uncharacterized protein